MQIALVCPHRAALKLPVACAWCAPRVCKRPASVPAAQKTATDRARESSPLNTVATRERRRERGIKYEIVGVEYVIEIIYV